MKLAQALASRADCQRRIEQLRQRLVANAKVQEGEAPAEDPALLMAELETAADQLEDLVARINLTNAGTDVNGLTLTALIAKRGCLQKRVRAMRRFLGTASQTAMRSRGSEIIVKSTVPVRELQKGLSGAAVGGLQSEVQPWLPVTAGQKAAAVMEPVAQSSSDRGAFSAAHGAGEKEPPLHSKRPPKYTS